MTDPAATNTSRFRQKVRINAKLDKNLAAYMAAAGAAGVSLLAAQPAEAKIVYTAANTRFTQYGKIPLDLNHDGINDFFFSHWSYDQVAHLSVVHEAASNGVIDNGGGAIALPSGAQIGPGRVFKGVGSMVTSGSVSNISFAGGPWKDKQNRYLGLKFSINGEMHYGWARLTVKTGRQPAEILTGYAYETVPNRPIIMGQTSGTDTASAVMPEAMLAPSDRSATLGMLAQGSDSLAAWRREEEVIAPAA
jgi:hypothetical protein